MVEEAERVQREYLKECTRIGGVSILECAHATSDEEATDKAKKGLMQLRKLYFQYAVRMTDILGMQFLDSHIRWLEGEVDRATEKNDKNKREFAYQLLDFVRKRKKEFKRNGGRKH